MSFYFALPSPPLEKEREEAGLEGLAGVM